MLIQNITTIMDYQNVSEIFYALLINFALTLKVTSTKK